MKDIKTYIKEQALDTEFKEIVRLLEFNTAGQLYSGKRSKTKREQEQEDMSWTNRHGYRDGKVWHDIFTKDYSGTFYGRIMKFFQQWFIDNKGFDIGTGEHVDTKHVTSVPAGVQQLNLLINGTTEVRRTANKKTGVDDIRSKPKNESAEDYIIHYKNLNCITEDKEGKDNKEDNEVKGPTGYPGLEALIKSNNKFALDKKNSTNIYMDEKKRPLGVSIFADPNGKSLQAFRKECKDEKYAECPHIFHLEFIRGLEDQYQEFFKVFVMKDIEKQFEMKKQTSKEKKEIKQEIKQDDDGLPPATDRTITISYLDDSFAKLYSSFGFKVYDKKNKLMVGVL